VLHLSPEKVSRNVQKCTIYCYSRRQNGVETGYLRKDRQDGDCSESPIAQAMVGHMMVLKNPTIARAIWLARQNQVPGELQSCFASVRSSAFRRLFDAAAA